MNKKLVIAWFLLTITFVSFHIIEKLYYFNNYGLYYFENLKQFSKLILTTSIFGFIISIILFIIYVINCIKRSEK